MSARALRGFTLVELLIVLTTGALVMLVLFASLRTLARATEATEAVGARAEDIRLVSQFLQNAFAGAVQQGSAAEENPQDSGQPAPARAFFQANERALRFASVLRTRHGLTGAHYLELAVRQPEPDVPAQLVLYAQPWQPRFTGWGKGAAQVLVEHLEHLEFAYQGADPAGAWHTQWPPAQEDASARATPPLPARVRIRMKADGRVWPELIYALSAL